MKSLNQLIAYISPLHILGDSDIVITTICLDSREATPGSLFVAIHGNSLDGHQYIDQAIEKGSIAIVCQQLPDSIKPRVTYISVADTSQALGWLASAFYNYPARHLKLVAVTGTSGKTSTVHLLYGLFKKLGYTVGMLSTIHNKINEEVFPSTLTTPHALATNQWLDRMVQAGCTHCFMEASSHAIVQHRLTGIDLVGAIFLNISHDHLDYHETFKAYIQAKKTLFDRLPASCFALYNADDKNGKIMIQNTTATCYSYSLQRPADFHAKLLSDSWEGLHMDINHTTVFFQLLGKFNAYNLLAAYAGAILLDQSSEAVLVALSALTPIVGRFQTMTTPKGIHTIIDYAHKPDALEKVLLSIQAINKKSTPSGRIITIVGCGGNRDTQKRPLMAQIGYRLSDQLILTSDNPRYEDPACYHRRYETRFNSSSTN